MASASAFLRQHRTILTTAAMTFPTALWLHDTFYSLHRVRGASMEPSLQHGDIILVRRGYFFPYWKARRDEDIVNAYDATQDDIAKDETIRDAMERQRIRRVDASWEWHSHGLWLYSPYPLIRAGDVVIFHKPDAYPIRNGVKRVVSTGRQRVRPGGNLRSIENVPADCIWVEGDNIDESVDSRNYGPVNKRLIAGKVERILWPPSRVGETVTWKRPQQGRAWSIDSYDDDDDSWCLEW